MRKTVLIIGNGYDMDLGRKTSYKNFWESAFCPKDYPAPLIAHLNGKWKDNLDAVKWYDLENELYNYAQKIREKSPKNYDVITQDEARFLKAVNPDCLVRGYYTQYEEQIQDLYKKGVLFFNDGGFNAYMDIPYLNDLRESAIWRDQNAFKLIKDGLNKYLQSIKHENIRNGSLAFAISNLINESTDSDQELKIYNFNYTELPFDPNEGNSVHYVHGNNELGNIIIGTRDDEFLDESYDFFQKSFDPDFNPPAVVYDLLEADEILIFGHSLGWNDNQYFRSFFMQRTSPEKPIKKTITIFTRDEKSEIEIKRALQTMTSYNLSALYAMNELRIIKSSDIGKRTGNLKEFLMRYIKDEAQVRRFIGGLAY